MFIHWLSTRQYKHFSFSLENHLVLVVGCGWSKLKQNCFWLKEFFKHVESLDESDDDDEYVDFSEKEGEGFFKEVCKEFIDTIDEQSREVESIGHEHLEGFDPLTFRSDHN